MAEQLTKAQMLIAADMCDARKVTLNGQSSGDEVEAGAWLFDNGVFFLGEKGCDEVAAMLRARAILSKSTPS